MDRENYVTPETDNALRWVRLMLAIAPEEHEAKILEGEIFNQSWEQAAAESSARRHQEALDIYRRLLEEYPEPPIDRTLVQQKIERETRKLDLLRQMQAPYYLRLKHRIGPRFLIFGSRENRGVLKVDGFGIEFQSTEEHSFKVAFDAFKSVKSEKGKLYLEGIGVPDGKIELEPADDSENLNLSGAAAKIEEYRHLYREYVQP
jgi:hypothetical protein